MEGCGKFIFVVGFALLATRLGGLPLPFTGVLNTWGIGAGHAICGGVALLGILINRAATR
jgi:hypothetical protein